MIDDEVRKAIEGLATKKTKMKSPLECWLTMVFNEWMRRYIDEPKAFEAEFASVIAFKDDDDMGKIPSYGDTCARYVVKLGAELAAKALQKLPKSARKKKSRTYNVEVSASVTGATKRRRVSAAKR